MTWSVGLPICAVCKTRVTAAECGVDLWNDMSWVKVHCHGSTEKLTATAEELEDGKRWPPLLAFEEEARGLARSVSGTT